MVDLNGKLRLHELCRHSVVRLGAEAMPVIVVDNLFSDPESLIEYAAAHSVFEAESDTFYPGSRAPVPGIYCFALRAFLGTLIEQTFNLPGSAIKSEASRFSIVTTPAQQLDVPQQLPHADSTNPGQLALLHYLCGPGHGGTSFYRHRRTQFEFVDAKRLGAYRAALAADLATLGKPSHGYICGDDAMFIRTASFDAVFNRLLIYQSINLHSADIHPGFAFDSDPRSGRLTANTFFYYS